MEQVIVGLFTEVRRHKPSVIYIPNIDAWYATLRGTIALITFQTMLRSIAPTDPVLLFATAECERGDLPEDLMRDFFGFSRKNLMCIPRPAAVCRPIDPDSGRVKKANRIAGKSQKVFLGDARAHLEEAGRLP